MEVTVVAALAIARACVRAQTLTDPGRKEFPKYNSANLEKHGVLETSDCAYVFVHENHPAVGCLRVNKDLLGSDIDKQQKIDNEWYKVRPLPPPPSSCGPLQAHDLF